MVLLSSAAVLGALICLVYSWRALLEDSVVRGFWLLVASAGLAVLGLLAKETAALLLVYALCIYYFLNEFERPASFVWRRLVPWVLWVGIAAFIVVVFIGWDRLIDDYLIREFTLVERLLSQPRALLDYALQTVIPKPASLGLFHDDFAISHSVFDPLSTFWAICFWFIALLAAIYARTKGVALPLVLLCWYLGGHSVEASALALELYFEHRNYLPSLAVWVAIVALSVWLWRDYIQPNRRKVFVFIAAAYAAVILAISVTTNILWGDPARLAYLYSEERSGSIRARALKIDLYQQVGEVDRAFSELIRLEEDFRGELAPQLLAVEFDCFYEGRFNRGLTEDVVDAAKSARYSNGALAAVESLIELEFKGNGCDNFSEKDLIDLVDSFGENPKYKRKYAMLHGFAARISWESGSLDQALARLLEHKGGSFQNDQMLVVLLATMHRYQEAVDLIKVMRSVYPFEVELQADYFDKLEAEIKLDIEVN
ncbi:hypothetical protein [uncultured Pseudoteredinibacter sp.]|uniref:hypothetical protein n=1 Tax=uncultured Pseudoteredinibacter sp. TaxID=1641701 RepID=UPI00260AD125|nr:hypothetical protein [uncultured Pseudoteredinibacter sp.]